MSRFTSWLQWSFRSPLPGVISAVAVCLLMAGYSLWVVSAGMIPVFPRMDNAYLDLGQSFLHGQTSLLEKPDPRLAALEDPYDPTQRDMPYRWDASYYEGEYYLYWGPVPALIFSLVERVARAAPVGSLVVVVSYIGIALSLLFILLRFWMSFFPNAPGASPALFILLGLVNLPFLFLLGRPDVYETSIIAGQFFLMVGLLGWIMYVTGSVKRAWLILAGLGWGLAIGSRYNLFFSVIIYMVCALVWLKKENPAALFWKRSLHLFVPVFLCVAALGVYNFARFENPFETGFRYQLSIPEVQRDSYSPAYSLSNLYVYLFYPLTTSGTFPFFLSTLPAGMSFDEIVAGLFSSTPGAWLLVLAVPCLILSKKTVARNPVLNHLTTMIVFGGTAQFLFLMTFFFGAMRYMADFYPALTLGISILVWRMDELLRSRQIPRAALWLPVFALILWTAIIGFFGGFDIPPQIFRSSNPELYARLADYWNSVYINFIR